ncbi:MAG: hypothetical protein IPJ49_02420 [Candidatus Obscuribacter sp.]|nr:hypothetical protein [Candidatus Obscuribacter sp.]
MSEAAKSQGNQIDAPPVAKGDNAVGAGQPLTSDQLQAQTGDRGIAPSYAPAASSSAARGMPQYQAPAVRHEEVTLTKLAIEQKEHKEATHPLVTQMAYQLIILDEVKFW